MSDTLRILTLPRWQFFTSDGSPAAGYYVYTYEPGTTTNKATYQDSEGAAAHTNPIVLDARGEKTIYWDGLYKIAVYTGDKDVDGVLVYTEDNYGVNVQTPTIGNYNLITNGDFETATADPTQPDNWTITEYTDGTVAIDSTDQYAGVNALKFASVGTGGGYAESNFFSVQEGKNVALNWAMKSSVANVRNVVELIWYTSAQVQISTTSIYDDSTTNPTSWTAKVSKATPPSTARYAKIRLTGCHESVSTVGNTWFDNVMGAIHVDGDGSGLIAGNVGSMTQAQLDAIELLSTSEIEKLDESKHTASGFDYTNINFTRSIFEQTPYVVSGKTSSTWESIGPTGSGATNICTLLDDIPLDAKWVEVTIITTIADVGTSPAWTSWNVFARDYGSSAAADGETVISGGEVYKYASSLVEPTTYSVNDGIIIPLDAANRFELYFYVSSFVSLGLKVSRAGK